MEPYGTPAIIGNHVEDWPLIILSDICYSESSLLISIEDQIYQLI